MGDKFITTSLLSESTNSYWALPQLGPRPEVACVTCEKADHGSRSTGPPLSVEELCLPVSSNGLKPLAERCQNVPGPNRNLWPLPAGAQWRFCWHWLQP